MPLKGHTFRHPRDLLTGEQIALIHDCTLTVLKDTGVAFGGEQALRILEGGGCQVDRPSGRVRFPRHLVEECLALCPASFPIRARHHDYDLEVGGTRLYFQSHPGLYVHDLDTGQRREALLADIGPLTRLLDGLEEIHLSIVPSGTIADRPPEIMTEWVTAEQMRNTQKVTATGVLHACAKWIIEMARVTDQQVYGQMNSISPLTYPADQVEGGLEYVAAGHPLCILPGPTLGANSPATLAGTLVLQNAEHLAGIVLVQLYRPGAPVTLASYPHVMDMRKGIICIGGVETGLLGAALAQLGRHYGIPTHPEFPLTDSKVPDEQAAIEKAMTAVVLTEAGCHILSNGGGLETEKAWSPVQAVIDNEINAMVGRILEGIAVTEQTLAVDAIQEAALSGNFLGTAHTLHTWKQEQFLPRLADRWPYETWQEQGPKDMVERARERAQELVHQHRVPPLPEDQDRELERILEAAEKEKLG
jgi:trimethylamine--corrinoid protein Co-methyltransferase